MWFFLVVDDARIRRDLTAETTLASEDNQEGGDEAGPHEEVNPSGGDNVVLGQGGAEVSGADEVKLQRDDLTVTDGLAHVNVFCHDRGAEGGGSELRASSSAHTNRRSNTAEHFILLFSFFKFFFK